MKKRNGKRNKAGTSKARIVAETKQQDTSALWEDDFLSVCERIVREMEEKKTNSADYYFYKAMLAREAKTFQAERQAVLNLLSFVGTPLTLMIQSALNNNSKLLLSDKISNIFTRLASESTNDDYISIIRAFILSGTKQQIPAYFNCLMGTSPLFNEELPIFDISCISENQLLLFYEQTHRILLDDSNNKHILEKLTYFISDRITDDGCQSLLFFMSYFNIIEVPSAEYFLKVPNLSSRGTSYFQTLASNTAWVAINSANEDEAEYWLDYIDDEDKVKKIKQAISELKAKITARNSHPLNPDNILTKSIDQLTTKTLMILCAFIHGCGDDWGLKPLKYSGKYIFPSREVTIELYKKLALEGVIKTTTSAFLTLDEDKLSCFDSIVLDEKFHLNIIGIMDSKSQALPVLYDELNRRQDLVNVAWLFWRIITKGYFYNALEYYLSNVVERWAQEFSLNEKTTERVEASDLSAKDLVYIARSATGYAAGQHSIGGSMGNRHTCNILIGSINRNFDWVDEGRFYAETYERSKKQPVLSSETLLENFLGMTPEDIYNLPPLLQEIQQYNINEGG